MPILIIVPTFESDVFSKDALHYLLLVVPGEGRTEKYHHEQYHSHRPDIALLRVVLKENLRGYIVSCPQPLSQHLFRLLSYSNAEIDYLYSVCSFLEKHVLWLEVPMHNSDLMQVNQRSKDLLGYGGRALHVHFFCYDLFKQLPSLTKLHDQNVIVFIVVDLVKFGNVRVVEAFHDGHFFEQLFMLSGG